MSNTEWRLVKLGDVCQYTKDKISIKELNVENYISTENMLPNKAGVVNASSLPEAGNAIRYRQGQTLVSNIRPYFKKIWYANKNGGCSNDVLVFKANADIDDKFLYYTLSQDAFFEHMMAGSKGTKMPRGDKQQIMMYQLLIPSMTVQVSIAKIFSCLDDKIELNNRINKTLEEMAQAIFKQWFVDFDFPDENGQPYKSSGGEMEESELGLIPKGWKVGCLGDITNNYDSKRIPLSKMEREKRLKIYPYYGAASLMDYVDDYLFDGIYVLMGEDGTVVDAKGYPQLQYVWGKFWVNNHAHVLQGSEQCSTEYIYLLLKNTNVSSIVTGAVQPKINQGNLNSIKTIIPSNDILVRFSKYITHFFSLYRNNCEQNINLSFARDSLLPKLMSGEIRVPVEEVPQSV